MHMTNLCVTDWSSRFPAHLSRLCSSHEQFPGFPLILRMVIHLSNRWGRLLGFGVTNMTGLLLSLLLRLLTLRALLRWFPVSMHQYVRKYRGPLLWCLLAMWDKDLQSYTLICRVFLCLPVRCLKLSFSLFLIEILGVD
jgi:hypothetical protein